MTYCIGVLLDNGMIFASDSRTNAGMDSVAKFCKMTVFERPGDRVITLLSSGNLAGTQAVISILTQRCAEGDAPTNLFGARTMFDVLVLVTDAMREIENRDSDYLEGFNASFIVGGQIDGEPMRLFRTYAEGNFIEAGTDTHFFQTGETKYGKPILDRVLTRNTPLVDATKCVLVSFDSTMLRGDSRSSLTRRTRACRIGGRPRCPQTRRGPRSLSKRSQIDSAAGLLGPTVGPVAPRTWSLDLPDRPGSPQAARGAAHQRR